MTAQTQAPVLSTPESHLFETPTPSILPQKTTRLPDPEFRNVYEVERTALEIQQGGYTKVALQFPDSMLVDAPRVFETLSKELENPNEEKGSRTRLYILADTSYGSCCVDEVAAEHVDAQVVVHYGRACLSPTSRLPVIYVYTTRPLDLSAALLAFENNFNSQEKHVEKVVIMADLTLQSHLPSFLSSLQNRGWKAVRSTAVVRDPEAAIPNREILWEGEEGEGEGALKEYRIWHLGTPPSALLLTLSSRIHELLIYPTHPSTLVERSNSSPQLRRRYALLTRLTTVPIIGILINTLSVKNYLDSIDGLKKLIAGAGKKSYTFVVGKVNAAKMANFAEVGGWVVVGCWESSLVESGEFYAPVVTPFELGLALVEDGERVWSGEWRGDFGGVLEGGEVVGKSGNGKVGEEEKDGDEDGDINGDEDSEEESAPPEFDLRTGRYVSHSRPMRTKTMNATSSQSEASKVLTRRPKQELASVNGAVSPGAEFLRSQRTWTGLGSDFERDGEGGTIEEGRSGVARGYTVGDGGERT